MARQMILSTKLLTRVWQQTIVLYTNPYQRLINLSVVFIACLSISTFAIACISSLFVFLFKEKETDYISLKINPSKNWKILQKDLANVKEVSVQVLQIQSFFLWYIIKLQKRSHEKIKVVIWMNTLTFTQRRRLKIVCQNLIQQETA